MTTAATSVRASTPATAAHASRTRRAISWTLVVVASVLCAVAILTTWVNRQMLDNTAWQKASEDVIQDPQVRASLSTYLVNQLYENTDVAAALQQQLPANLKHLAPQLAAALRGAAVSTANALLSRPRVQTLFVASSSVAHEKLVNVLENKTGHGITTGNGVVTLNVKELLQELTASLGLPGKLVAKIPADKANLVLLRSDQLSAAQKGVRAIKVLSGWLLVLVFGMYALAVYLARGSRRAVLRRAGWALVIVGALVLVVRNRLGSYAIDTLASPTYRGTIHHVWLIGTSILGQIGNATVAYGLLLVLAAVLAGPTRAAVAARRSVAPYLNHYPWLVATVSLFAYGLLLLWGPTHALRMWWGMLLFAALGAAAILALRRQTLAEFPAA
jgi:hypothetical protein